MTQRGSRKSTAAFSAQLQSWSANKLGRGEGVRLISPDGSFWFFTRKKKKKKLRELENGTVLEYSKIQENTITKMDWEE